jgi:hypothetical protein
MDVDTGRAVAEDVLANRREADVCNVNECCYPTLPLLAEALLVALDRLAVVEARVGELEAALKDEMKWDMGGVPEPEWKRRAVAAEAQRDTLAEAHGAILTRCENANVTWSRLDVAAISRAALAAVAPTEAGG